MNYKFISSILIIVLFVQSFIQDVDASTHGYNVTVPVVQQVKPNWCWAACAEMQGKSIYSSSSRDQYNVVYYLKGSSTNPYPNVTGSISNLRFWYSVCCLGQC